MKYESVSKARSELARRVTERAARMIETRTIVAAPGEPLAGQSALDGKQDSDDQWVLFVASKCSALRQTQHGGFNTFFPAKSWYTGEAKIDRRAIQRLIDQGKMRWVNSCHSAAVLTGEWARGMKSLLHAQASAVDVMAVQARQRGNIKMRPGEWEMLERGLSAACRTLLLMESSRHLLPASFIAEVEGEATS